MSAKDWDDTINPENTQLKERKESKKELKRHPEVDLYLSTIDKLILNDAYDPGSFFKRLLRRFNLVDDFWMDGIACAAYNPNMRRISIKINPLMLWDYLLRHVAVKSIDPDIVRSIDRTILEAFENGGWKPEAFASWMEFLTSSTVIAGSDNEEFSNGMSKIVRTFMSVIVHEIMHCSWNHLAKPRHSDDHKVANIAQDFAINQTLDFTIFNPMFMTTENKSLLLSFYLGGAKLVDGLAFGDDDNVELYEKIKTVITETGEVPKELLKSVNISHFDDHSFLNQPYEYYYNLLMKAGESLKDVLKNSQMKSSMGIGKDGKERGGDIYDYFQHTLGEELDGMTDEEKSDAIKKACGGIQASPTGISQFDGFNPMTSEMKKVLGNDLNRTVDEMIAKGEINDPSDLARMHPFNLNSSFVNAIENLYKTDVKDWDRLLKNQIMKCLGYKEFDYTMKREARGAPGMFPGKARLKSFDLIIIMDVSGSINHDDYNRFVNEIEKIAKQVDHPVVRYIQFHSEVSLDIKVPLKAIRKVGIPETGGTVLRKPLDMLANERNKKMVVVFTDGWVENDIKNTYHYPTIIFVSSSGNGEICSSLLDRGFKVIHQDGDNSWWK